jgi:hypothetical protein
MAHVRIEIYKERARLFALKKATELVFQTDAAILRRAKERILTRRYKTGALYRSGRARMMSYTYRVIGTVSFGTDHAMVIHRGARPHLIRPRNAGGLLFYWAAVGRVICFKGTVRHPGIQGERYLTVPMFIEAAKRGFRVVIPPNV